MCITYVNQCQKVSSGQAFVLSLLLSLRYVGLLGAPKGVFKTNSESAEVTHRANVKKVAHKEYRHLRITTTLTFAFTVCLVCVYARPNNFTIWRDNQILWFLMMNCILLSPRCRKFSQPNLRYINIDQTPDQD